MFKTYVEIPYSNKKIIGSGSSKKDAQQDAAGKAIKSIKTIMNWEDEMLFIKIKENSRENANIINVFTMNKSSW